jgi:hypothetical protein
MRDNTIIASQLRRNCDFLTTIVRNCDFFLQLRAVASQFFAITGHSAFTVTRNCGAF